jgi:phosphoribosyl 1,2-cyclic phosphodiesterase
MIGAPDIQLVPLGSGSKGNCTFVGTPHAGLLIDGGFSARETLARLHAAGIASSRIQALLITHEHSDHIGGAGAIARKLQIPVYMTRGTQAAVDLGKLPEVVPVVAGEHFSIGEIHVEPIPLPHDAAEPVAYAMSWGGRRWVVLTDFGYPTRLVVDRIRGCDMLLLEANHDEELLLNGPYPWGLKMRIRGRHGHLSNNQTVSILEEVVHPGLRGVALLHLSETNNRPELPYGLCRHKLDHLDAGDIPLWVAPQERPLEGLVLNSL